jgi:hypothetical protein
MLVVSATLTAPFYAIPRRAAVSCWHRFKPPRFPVLPITRRPSQLPFPQRVPTALKNASFPKN